MSLWYIAVKVEGLEYYEVEAASEAEARERIQRGDVPEPYYSEVNDTEILSIELGSELVPTALRGSGGAG